MKTKALTSFAVTAKLICAFDFAYADCWFSHAAAHIICKEDTSMTSYNFQCLIKANILDKMIKTKDSMSELNFCFVYITTFMYIFSGVSTS